MPRQDGQRFNWYHRHWHDWPQVYRTVVEVAIAHARYLGYEYRGPWDNSPPPGDLAEVGPVMRIKLGVFRRTGKHRSTPECSVLTVDMERRPGGKFHPTTVAIERV
jgi:hypothetical protein